MQGVVMKSALGRGGGDEFKGFAVLIGIFLLLIWSVLCFSLHCL